MFPQKVGSEERILVQLTYLGPYPTRHKGENRKRETGKGGKPKCGCE